MNQPLVSVVTPFRNTAPYLAQCIESVLAQTHSSFEYILSDNCSTDGSGEIAETYVRRDPRVRLIRQSQLLSQAQHYNNVLTQISPDSRYCKIVQADDYIFPQCLQSMVQAFAQSESIGLVSSYWLKGNMLLGSGFPHGTSLLPGRELARLFLRAGVYVFGSESTVMYRSSLVRNCQPFFGESLLHADTEKCMDILEDWDFGFVPQVLSFLRMDNINESISAPVRSLRPELLDRYIIVQRYAPRFLEPDEAAALKRESKRVYYEFLAHEALRFRGSAFWSYHKGGLNPLGEKLDRTYLSLRIGSELLWLLANPGTTAAHALDRLRGRTSGQGLGNTDALQSAKRQD
ncbi:MAG: glycosyltransferase family 2 protein [Acidobacteriia bacterium]|nr:glycosyltransferase family 2 protein [Terriglobia bacterium]